ncbi:hypothetical protein AVM02_15950 [Brucella anthropi]
MPEGRKVVEPGGFDSGEAARNEVAKAIKAFTEKKKPARFKQKAARSGLFVLMDTVSSRPALR